MHQLIFNITDDSLARYDDSVAQTSDAVNPRRRYNDVRVQIESDMRISTVHYGKRNVAHYYRVPCLNAYAAFIFLCDATDPSRRGRAIITGRWDAGRRVSDSRPSVLYEWNEELTETKNEDLTTTALRLAVEYTSLKRWIQANVSTESARKNTFPYESVLRCIDETASVAARLATDLNQAKLDCSGKLSYLVFLVPGELVVHAEYSRRRIASVLRDLLTVDRDVYVVVDVGVRHDLCRVTDLVPVRQKNVAVKAYVALDTSESSCAVLHFSSA